MVTLERDGGFGFFLQDLKTATGVDHVLNQIAPGEPAALAGVLENDRVVEVNGTNVESLSHDQVVKMIRESGDTVSFLVVDADTDEHFKAKGIMISSALLAATHGTTGMMIKIIRALFIGIILYIDLRDP